MGKNLEKDVTFDCTLQDESGMIYEKDQEDCEMNENNTPAPVPFAAFESVVSIHERHIKRLLIALLITIILLAVTNVAWLYAWMQYDYSDSEVITETDVSQDGRGLNIYGDGNEVHNGAEDSNKDDGEEAHQD